jgi:hypothetical protein
VAKPLPVPDTSQLTSTTSDEGPEEENSVGGAALEDEEADENTNTEDNTEVRSAVSDMETDQEAAAPRQQGSLLSPEKRGGRRGDSISSDMADLPPPLPTSPLPEEEEGGPTATTSRRGSAGGPTTMSATSAMPMPATERLIGGTKKAAAPQPPAATSFMKAAEERSTAVALTTDADNIPALPTALEQRVRIAKDADTLGLQAGLWWIRTDLMRHPDTDPDPDPGFL